jgi:hypothetical protein
MAILSRMAATDFIKSLIQGDRISKGTAQEYHLKHNGTSAGGPNMKFHFSGKWF